MVDQTDVAGSDDKLVNDVKGLSILQLTGTGDGLTITSKVDKPTVDKQVQDEAADKDINSKDTDGWGETADHAMNEVFKFKVIANNLNSDVINKFDTYYIGFNDHISKGIEYVSTPTPTIKIKQDGKDDVDVTGKFDVNSGEYNSTSGTDLTFKLKKGEDLKTILETNQVTGGFTIEVEYSAKLNGDAVVSAGTANGEWANIENKNEVTLEYSNDPHTNSHGETEKDEVFVATFKLTNTKTDNKDGDEATKLSGAKFQLKSGDNVAVFKKQDNKNIFQEFRAANSDLGEGEYRDVESDENGDFSMIGLDAGTYQLVETKAPAGYNKVATPIDITILANHKEDGTGKVLVSSDNLTQTVKNSQTGSLPETGGMGTTMIYGVGALMVAGAAVVFVTNKRTRKE